MNSYNSWFSVPLLSSSTSWLQSPDCKPPPNTPTTKVKPGEVMTTTGHLFTKTPN